MPSVFSNSIGIFSIPPCGHPASLAFAGASSSPFLSPPLSLADVGTRKGRKETLLVAASSSSMIRVWYYSGALVAAALHTCSFSSPLWRAPMNLLLFLHSLVPKLPNSSVLRCTVVQLATIAFIRSDNVHNGGRKILTFSFLDHFPCHICCGSTASV